MRTQRKTRRLRFESLEDRRLLAVYTVSCTANSGAGSLREAITQANATQVADEIVFAPELSGATIELSNNQLNISNNLVIDATALPGGITIDGNSKTRLIKIEPTNVSIQLRGLTFTRGLAPGAEGTVVNYGTLFVDSCTFVDNSDEPIWNAGAVTISRSFFRRNIGSHATGIYNQGNATILDTTFAESREPTSKPVIETVGGSGRSLTIERSTIGGDEIPGDTDGQGSSIIDSYYFNTIPPFTSRVLIKNSIVVGKVDAPVNAEYSLLADVDPSLVTGTGYLLNLDPQLGPLADNGGRTPTYAVLPSSPALNAGDPNYRPAAGQTDQRGGPYLRVAGQLDMGAYEAQATPTTTPGDFNADGRVDAADYSVWRDHLGQSVAPFTAGDATGDGLVDNSDYRAWHAHFGFVPLGEHLVVNDLGDRDDGNIYNGRTTLREAINFSRTVTWANLITFDPTLSGGVIHVAPAQAENYQIGRAVTIDARMLPGGITLDAGNRKVGLYINEYAARAGNDFDVTLAGLTITGGVGHLSGGGGAINSLITGKLTIIDCQLLDSTSPLSAGALYARGDVELVDTLVDGATSSSNGAAVFVEGDLTLTRSTIRNVGDSTRKNVGIRVSTNSSAGDPLQIKLIDSAISETTGGGISASYSNVVLERSRIENNLGPGIVASRKPSVQLGSPSFGSTISLIDSSVSNNTLASGVSISFVATDGHYLGGAGLIIDGDVTLNRSRVDNNRVLHVHGVVGGGVWANGHVMAIDSSVSGNNAEFGGGVYVSLFGTSDPPGLGELVVTLVRATVDENESQYGGAAIHSFGSVFIDQSSLSRNRLLGTIEAFEPNGVVMLRANSHGQTMTITDSVLVGNTGSLIHSNRVATFFGGAVNVEIARSQILDNEMHGVLATRVVDSTIARNAGTGVQGDRIEILRSTISDNRRGGVASSENLLLRDSTIRGNSLLTNPSSAVAAGAWASQTLLIDRSLVEDNHTTYAIPLTNVRAGGGLRANTVLLVDSTVRDNSVSGNGALGGAINAFWVFAYGSTISGNAALGEAAHGGGLVAATQALLHQSTISGNRVEGTVAQGGGLWTRSLDSLHATIFGNEALGDETTGGGVYTDSVSRFVGSVSAGNTAAAAPDFRAVAVDPTETAPGVAYSLIQNTDGSPLATGGGGPGNLLGLDPLLGSLADNGGRTLTHAPLPGSPLIDAGDPTLTAIPFAISTPFQPPINIAGIFDQRGEPYARVVDGGSGTLRIDIGAVEVQAAPSLPALDAAFAGLPSDGLFEPADFDLLR